MIKAEVWQNARDVVQAYTPFYQQDSVQKIRDMEARDYWFLLLVGRGLEPQPLTLEKAQAVSPYTAPSRFKQRLDKAAENGFIRQKDGQKYRISDKGYAVLDAFFNTAQGKLAEAPSLSQAEMKRLAQLLGKIVSAVEMAPKPEHKASLASSRWTDPGDGAPAAVMVDQYITDLSTFRDDAHIAAWRPSGMDGRDFEALTFVWNGEAHTAAELAEKLENRGYTAEDYASTLHVLARRGWLQSEDGQSYQITADGQRMRDQIEEETDRLFYAGWSVLNEQDLKMMNQLLLDLKHVLKEAAEPEQEAEPAAA